MRRYLPAFILALAIAPFPLAGCDMINKLKGGGDDAGLDAAVEAAAVIEDAAPAVEPTPTGDAAPAPTTTLAPTPTTVRPLVTDAGVKADAAAPVDAGAQVVVDSGPAPAPTPTLKLPMLDAGLFRFDAGALRLPKVK